MTAKSIISKLRYVLALVVVACMVLGCGQQEKKVQANQNDTVVDSSIQGIVGTWFEDGVLDPRTLTIKADGTYELAYKGFSFLIHQELPQLLIQHKEKLRGHKAKSRELKDNIHKLRQVMYQSLQQHSV